MFLHTTYFTSLTPTANSAYNTVIIRMVTITTIDLFQNQVIITVITFDTL